MFFFFFLARVGPAGGGMPGACGNVFGGARLLESNASEEEVFLGFLAF